MATSSDDARSLIWRALETRRGHVATGGLDALGDLLDDLAVRVPADVVNDLALVAGHESGEFRVPEALTAFIGAIAVQRPRQNIVDPWCHLGQIAAEMARRCPGAKVRGITVLTSLLRVLRHLDAVVEWTLGRPDTEPELLGRGNDLVVCAPPFNVPVSSTDSGASEGELATNLLERACASLSEEGEALFVLSLGCWARAKTAGWRDRLMASGFSMRACFWLPSGTFQPLTAIPAVLVQFGHGEQKDIFVAELPASGPATRAILESFAKHRQAPDARLGRWMPLDRFVSLPQLLAAERLEQIGRPAGEAHRLGEVGTVQDWKPARDATPSAVLVPAEGAPSRPALVASSAGDVKGRYLAVEVNEELAVPEYLARYFSSELGRLARETATSGGAVPRLSKESLRDVTVYLPEIQVQRATVEAHAKIVTLLSELQELDDRLWAKPRMHEEVRSAVSKVNHEDRFDVWLETLPFPLATVLWLYATQRGPKDRVDTLLHFFEAYGEFWATTLLSLFLRETAGRHERKARLQAVLAEQKQSLEMASFGTWLTLVELLAKEGRELRGSPDGTAWLKQQAALADDRFFEVLVGKDVLRTLRAVNTLRNTWKGHGGVVTDEIAESRLSTIAAHLAELRGVVGERWSNYVLYRIGAFEFRDGIYVAQAERVAGTRAPFPTETIELTGPAETGRLHLVGAGARDAMPLLPFIKVMPSPRTAMNACYFYNRKTKEGVRFVSYHFAEDSDVTDRFDDTAREVESLSKGA